MIRHSSSIQDHSLEIMTMKLIMKQNNKHNNKKTLLMKKVKKIVTAMKIDMHLPKQHG